MTVRVYRSTDVGAPVLSNTPGAMVAVLDACLVDGYGSKPGSGWTKKYVGGNNRTYQLGGGSLQCYCTDNTSIGYGHYPRGGEWAPGGPFSTSPYDCKFWPDGSVGTFCPITDNTAGNRPWNMVADERGFIFWNQHNNTSNLATDTWAMQFFGDFTPINPDEKFNCIFYGDVTASTGQAFLNATVGNKSGHWAAREFHGIGSAAAVRSEVDAPWIGLQGRIWGNPSILTLSCPNPNTNAVDVGRSWVVSDFANIPRGWLRGIWVPHHAVNSGLSLLSAAFRVGTQIEIATPTGKRVLEYVQLGNYTQYACFVEISDTWDL